MPTERVHLASPVITAGERVIASPFQFEVTGEDHLRLSAWSAFGGEVITIALRTRTRAGDIQVAQHTHDTGLVPFTKTTKLIGLSSGFLLSAQLSFQSASSNVRRGDVFVSLELVRGFAGAIVPIGTLAQGYIAREASLAWPGSPIISPHEGPGRPQSWGISSPAAGNHRTIVVPTGVRWRLVSIHALLTTSAAVANRRPALFVGTVASILGLFPVTKQTAASSVSRNVWHAGGQTADYPEPTWATGPLPENLALVGGDSVQIFVSAIDPADQLSGIQLWVEQWLDP